MARNMIYQCMTPDFKIRNNLLLSASLDLSYIAPDIPQEIIVKFVNRIVRFPKIIDDPNVKGQVKEHLLSGLKAREWMGVCSLADSPNNDELWKNYAKEETGYCVEYKMDGYENNNLLFPVDYVEERQTNLVVRYVKCKR